ncbi:hypothetical protein D9M68_874690 [compost metagenome]
MRHIAQQATEVTRGVGEGLADQGHLVQTTSGDAVAGQDGTRHLAQSETAQTVAFAGLGQT